MSVLLVNRRRLQRDRHTPGQSRRDAVGGVARAAGETQRLQAADGVDVSLGVLARRRLQLRLQCVVDRAATARWRLRIQLPAWGTVARRGGGPVPVCAAR